MDLHIFVKEQVFIDGANNNNLDTQEIRSYSVHRFI